MAANEEKALLSSAISDIEAACEAPFSKKKLTYFKINGTN